METKRIEQIQKRTAYPESQSVREGLMQVWNEMQQDFNSKICQNCSKFNEERQLEDWSDGECEDGVIAILGVYKEFGCNRFKRKE